MKKSMSSSIMMRCLLQLMSNAASFGLLKANSHYERRGMDTQFMSLISFWRLQGISVSHRHSVRLMLNSQMQTTFEAWMHAQLFTQAKMPMHGGTWPSCSHRSKTPSPSLNTYTQVLLASGCLIAHQHTKH